MPEQLEGFLTWRPSREALAWVEHAVGGGAQVVGTRRLKGGTSAAVHEVAVERGGGQRERFVLRRYVRSDWLAREPDLAEREARALRLAALSGIPTPELVSTDADGSECDVPAVLMTRVRGRVQMAPRDLDGWLRQMAEALPAIHSVESAELSEVQRYRPWADLDALTVPTWTRTPEAWEAVIRLAQGQWPVVPGRYGGRFIHRDYHPMNVLWSRRRLSGVVDWTNASVGPPGNDVAWCRQNLVASHGVQVAERFRELYETVAGVEQDPVWDALGLVEGLPEPGGVVAQFHDVGITSLTRRTLLRRLDRYAATIAGRM